MSPPDGSVLIIHNDVTLADAYVNGVFAVFVTQAIAIATADHFFFAVALRNADLDVYLFMLAAFAAGITGIAGLLAWITALALAFAGAGIIDFNDLGHCTGSHFVQVHVLHVFEQVNRFAFSNRLWSRFLAAQLTDQQSQTHQGRNSKRLHVYLSLFEQKRRLNEIGADTPPKLSAASLLNQPRNQQCLTDSFTLSGWFCGYVPDRFDAELISNVGED